MNKLYIATIDHYKAKRSEALATLDIYFNNSVGIGEHSEILEEITKWAGILDTAESTLETLNRNFGSKFEEEPLHSQAALSNQS